MPLNNGCFVPLVCNDGVTIAKEMDLQDPEENLGVQMLRQAAEKTGEAVGDGTSTSILLAHAIFSDGIRNVVAGASILLLCEAIMTEIPETNKETAPMPEM